MLVHSVTGTARGRLKTSRPSLLDIAAQTLVARPAASLAEVAEAAGVSRTTLHKHYATREDLLRAVGHRATDLWEAAVDGVAGLSEAPDGGLSALTAALVPSGPQLAFLWRTPALDGDAELHERSKAVEGRCLAVLRRAQDRGVLRAGVPDWWLLETFYALIYVAAESVDSGHLAPRDAPELALDTLLRGLGAAAGPQAAQPPTTSP
jgi:AcrR family transcriptional regulator